MAKRKTNAKVEKQASRAIPIINMKGSPEYHAWISDLSSRTLIPVTRIIRQAVAEWAEKRGHSAPPEM
jgi:hypothetical protein